MTIVTKNRRYRIEAPMKIHILLLVFGASLSSGVSISTGQDKTLGEFDGRVDALVKAVESGKIVCHRTTPDEIKRLLGEPTNSNRDNDVIERLVLSYPLVEIHFSRFRMYEDDPFTLRSMIVRGTKLNIRDEGPPPLRSVDDLGRLDDLHDVSLRDLDLRGHGDTIKRLNFATTTVWPAPDKLPRGFDPQRLLGAGKNPGLGLRDLHEKGIDGKGISIAIIDQRLLIGHEEYSSRIIHYDATRASMFKPQFHGSPIVGIAVGKSCGVAPGAFVFYYALPRTDMPDNRIHCEIIDEIIRHNEISEHSERIRVINISSGAFKDSANYDLWRATCKKAQEAGILVVTCSDRFLGYGTLKLTDGKDPDNPESYIRNRYGQGNDTLQIPTGNKTIASYLGTNVYAFERGDGKSWAAPYIGGLAALAYQVDPEIKPQTIVEQLVKTTTRTKAGPVVNPRAFIKGIRTKRIVAVVELSSVDRSSPEATVRNWTRAVARGNVEGALACMLPGGSDYDNYDRILNANPSSRLYPAKKMFMSIDAEKPLQILDRQLTMEEADIEWEFTFKEDVTGDAAIRVPSIKKSQSVKVKARLEKLGDYWLINSIKPSD